MLWECCTHVVPVHVCIWIVKSKTRCPFYVYKIKPIRKNMYVYERELLLCLFLCLAVAYNIELNVLLDLVELA